MSQPRFRPVLESFVPYKPGQAHPGAAKLSSNESPYGPLPSVLEVIAAAAGGLNRYPDHGSAALSAAIAARLGVPAEPGGGGLRVGRPDPAATDRHRRAGRRGAVRLAVVRGLSRP